jgi:ADP-heptose:LPS heptosyltransferase
VGYYTKKRGFLLTKKVLPPPRNSVHRIDYYLQVLAGAGIPVVDRHTDFPIDEHDRRTAAQFLQAMGVAHHHPLVGINAGGNWGLKRWPAQSWAELADRLIKERGATVLITGSQQDVTLARQIARHMREKPVVAAGVLNLKGLAALCASLDLFITADTGPLHIADAIGAPRIVALFGPTLPGITGPRARKGVTVVRAKTQCSLPCYELKCPDNKCMKSISVDTVYACACDALKE